jgi:tetratricopeptide (TPR) repeat protein
LFFVLTAIFTYKFLVSDRVVVNQRSGIFQKLAANKAFNLVIAGLSFFLCLLSKESGITFLAVIPLMVWFFTDEKISKNITAGLCLLGVSAIFFMIRAKVLHDARGDAGLVGETAKIDNMMSGLSLAKRFPTAVLIMGMYLKTFLFPHPLVSDKSMREIEVVDFSDKWFLLSLLAYVAITAYAVLRFRKKDPIAFGIIYFFITASVASNIVMVIGTNYGERLMYAPSFGFCLAIGVLIAKFLRPADEGNKVTQLAAFFRRYSKAIAAVAVIFVLYSFKTITRNADWYDNLTLYEQDIRTAPLSARTHFYLGNYLSQDDFLKENAKDSVTKTMYLDSALNELRRATKIYPGFGDAWQQIGKIYLNKKDFKTAAENYEKAIAINPQTPIYHNNYGNVLFSVGRYDDARREFSLAVQCNPGYSDAYGNLGAVYGTMGEIFVKQGKQQEAAQNFQLAIANYQKVTQLEPDKSMPYYFISITYKSLGNEAEAQRYMGLYNQLKQQGK